MSDTHVVPIPEGHLAVQFLSGRFRFIGDDTILARFYRNRTDCRILRITYTAEDET